MTINDIYDVLKIISDTIGGEKIIRRIDGSTNLILQGIDTNVRDLDISTNDEGIEIFRKCLSKYIVKDNFIKKISKKSLICDINGFEVEINYYGDRRDMFDKIEKYKFKNIVVPTLPLKYAKIFYENIGRKEKVDLINKYLLSNS